MEEKWINVSICGYGPIIILVARRRYTFVIRIRMWREFNMVNRGFNCDWTLIIILLSDHWHYIFISVTLAIFLIVLFASIWDARQNTNSTLGHYKRDIKSLSTAKTCLLCFSPIRNWFRLTATPKTELAKDIRFTHAVRYIATFVFVLAHQLLGYSLAPTINPEFVEQTYHNHDSVALHNTNTVQTFFLLSGFLLYISINQVFKKHEFNFKYFWIGLLYRYVRLVPILGYWILFDASFLYDSGVNSGGHWKFWTEAEKKFCRRNWWTNLLFINNYVNQGQMVRLLKRKYKKFIKVKCRPI